MTESPSANSAMASSQIFETLKQDLIRGRFAAGEKLAISALKDHYRVGLSPLREALNRLAAYALLDDHIRLSHGVARGCCQPSLGTSGDD